jgi:heavy metal sensor kinase
MRILIVEDGEDEFGRLATVFNETLARLEESFERLRRFTSDASHELRTPLTAIRAVGEVGLREPRRAEQYREIVGSMLEEVDRLARLVDSLLTLSRADAGRITLHPERVDLAALAREVSAHLGVLAEEKRERLDLDAAGPVEIAADRAILRLAVVNLIDNAIKYAPPGSAVGVAVAADDGTARLAVRDRGPGIAREHQARVFDRFHRADAGRSRDAGGAGLGLAIARWAVEAHGGRIEVESADGEGSTFTIVLPIRRDAAQGGGS